MLTPTAISTEPALSADVSLLPIPAAGAPPKPAGAAGAGENAPAGVAGEGEDFAAMLSTMLAPAGSEGQKPASAMEPPPPLVPASTSMVIAALPAVRPEAAELEGDSEVAAEDEETGEDGLASEEADEECAVPENTLPAAWLFLPPPPASLALEVVQPTPRFSSGDATPPPPEAAAGSVALPETAVTPRASNLAPAVLAQSAGQPSDHATALVTPGVPVSSRDEQANIETALPQFPAFVRALSDRVTVPAADAPMIPATPARVYQRRGSAEAGDPLTVMRAEQSDTTGPAASAQFAGNALPSRRVAPSSVSDRAEKRAEVAAVDEVAKARERVGIEPANASPRMPAALSATPPMTAELPPVVSASPAVETANAPAAVQAVEKVLDAVETAAQAGGNSVQLRLELGDAGPLTVHVSLRNGEVHAVFRSDSVEMREMLAAAWSQQAPGREITAAHAPLAEPEFRPLREVTPVAAATGESSLHSQADAHSGHRQQASGQATPEFVPSSRSRLAARSDSFRNEPATTPRTAVPSVHLSTFA